MTRSNAREIACHLVFEMNFNNITAGEALQTLMDDGYYPTLKTETDVYAEKPDGKQLEYLTSVVQGVQAKREELRATSPNTPSAGASGASPEWPWPSWRSACTRRCISTTRR